LHFTSPREGNTWGGPRVDVDCVHLRDLALGTYFVTIFSTNAREQISEKHIRDPR